MKRFIRNICALGLTLLMAFSVVACKENVNDSINSSTNDSINSSKDSKNSFEELIAKGTKQESIQTIQKNQLHEVNVTETNNPFVAMGATGYKIIIPPNDSDLIYAADELVDNLALATKCEIQVEINKGKYKEHDPNKKWIVLGDPRTLL